MLLKSIGNLLGTAVVLGLTHIPVTHTITQRTAETLQTASVHSQMHFSIFLGTNLCLNAQILPFSAYFLFCLCAYILFVLFPC